jgi:hypothetical protein
MLKILLAIGLVTLGLEPAMAEPSCGTHTSMSAVDLSQSVTTITTKDGKTGFDGFRKIGVNTIIRYYDWPTEDVSCKVLLPAESNAIVAAGFSILTVFQHENSDPETFLDHSRGATDAKYALQMAAANGQPQGSAIYFAVDGVDQTITDAVYEYRVSKAAPVTAQRRHKLLKADRGFAKHIKFYERFLHYHRSKFGKPADEIRGSEMLPHVEHYFRAVRDVFKSSGKSFKIGGYGSGATCQMLLGRGLVDYCWLAMSTGWPGHDAFLASNKWVMVQQRSTACKNWQYRGHETVHFDFNRVNPAKSNFGQWSNRGPVTPLKSLPTICTNHW